MAILGILSGIASHQFLAYTQRAYDSRAETDLHNLVTAEEAYYAEHEAYVSCATSDCRSLLPGYLTSLDVQIDVSSRDDGQTYDATAQHPGGEKKFTFSSDAGTFSYIPKSS
jgi:Tfp pilus assembly protein PilE